MATKVINLFGGSGVGKSTLAAGLFAEMKLRGENVELVREFVKGWAWDGLKVGPFDQIYILGKQAKTESRLYNKVDWIVTDSPLLLSAIYEGFYNGHEVTGPAAFAFMDSAKQQGVEYVNFLLPRNKPYDPRGRYQTEEEIGALDEYVKAFLLTNRVPYTVVEGVDRARVDFVLKQLGFEGFEGPVPPFGWKSRKMDPDTLKIEPGMVFESNDPYPSPWQPPKPLHCRDCHDLGYMCPKHYEEACLCGGVGCNRCASQGG